MKIILFGVFSLLCLTGNAIAYQEPTHQNLSIVSTDRSILQTSNILGDIGLNNSVDSLQNFNNYISKDVEHTVVAYIEAGSNFEDAGLRSLNHFYDPYNNIGLNSWIGYKSPNWALEDDELYELPEQEFSLSDANDYLYRALSGKDPENETKETNFGKLFRTIGQVIHHVQDMAQPQHVRDDDHCGEVACSKAEFLGVFNPSLYEELSNGSRNELSFSGYGNVSFPKARDFWHNSNWSGMADFTNQNFISIGTNFIVNKDGTFTTNRDYPEPKPFSKVNDWSVKDIETELPTEYNLSGVMAFVSNSVTDRNLTGTSATVVNDYGSALSIFDQDLELEDACVQYTRKVNGETKTYTYETCRLFTYNKFNVKAAQNYLIPRAVAYSAGLINHFFRGRLDVTKTESTTDTAGNSIVAITIKNTSAQNLSMTNGKLEIFYDAIVDGVEIRKAVQLADGETGNVTEITNGAETIINIISPTDVDPDKENPFVVVFRGNIGIDPGVAGKVFKIEGETAFLLFYVKNGNRELSLKRSDDNGKTWQQINDSSFNGFKYYNNGKGPQFVPSNISTGVLAGRYSSGLAALRTTDNGKTWSEYLHQISGQYSEITNVARAVHTGNGRLVTFNSIYTGTTTINSKTVNTYDTELSESFDDGENWVQLNFSFDAKGSPSQIYYLGNGHLYLRVVGYDGVRVWYESYDSGINFTKANFNTNDLKWEWYSAWYRDTFNFDTEEIITIKNTSTDLNLVKYNFAISNDGGQTLTLKDKAAKNTAWPQAEPLYIRPYGQGKFVSYVFDPWTAYETDLPTHYEGILVSEDKGSTWKEVYQGQIPTAGYPYFIMMGIVTKDPIALNYLH